MSAYFGFDGEVWEILYEKLLTLYDLPQEVKDKLVEHREKIRKIYAKIEGKWWKRGWLRIFYLENKYGKMAHELHEDIKAIDIVLKDLDLCKKSGIFVNGD